MIRVTYNRFTGYTTRYRNGEAYYVRGHDTVSYTFPHEIELLFRFLRVHCPAFKYVHDWDPSRTPAWGHYLEYDRPNLILRSNQAPYTRDLNAEITWKIENSAQLRVAARGIADYMTQYQSLLAKKTSK